jgi:ferrous iron transport protein B
VGRAGRAAFALLGGLGKASGALDRLGGRGRAARALVRARRPRRRPRRLGFGCNVPAVTATRACALCSRRAVIAAIAFGSACSYQLGATLSVFAAAGEPGLVVPYLGWLGATMLVHTRLVAGRSDGGLGRLEVVRHRTFLTRPRPAVVWRDASGTLRAFVRTAMPVFVLICVVASLLGTLGVLDAVGAAMAGPLALLGLPVEATTGVVAAAVRKDGILLLAEPGALAAMDAAQLLAATYLASVLTPCLVTALAIAREQSVRVAAGLLARQALTAVVATALLVRLARLVL